jgi:hypothetical protein
MLNEHDKRSQRCRRLGSEVSFEYCRLHAEQNQVCSSIIQCWWEHFDIVSFLEKYLTKEQLEALQQPVHKPKVTRLMEIIEDAQRRLST